MSKNKAKTAVSVAVEAKPEVEIRRRPKNQLFNPGFPFAPSDRFQLRRRPTVSPQYKTSQTTEGQTPQCTKGATDALYGRPISVLTYLLY